MRRRAIDLAYVNGAWWAIGNALTTGTLIHYLAIDLGAQGLTLSLILALPALVGLLRLAAPVLIRTLGGIKRSCLASSLVSYVLLLLLPFVIAVPGLIAREQMMAFVVGLICVHQLFEYIAQVALFSWLAELVPPQVRGRFFAARNMWQLAVVIPTLLGSGLFADWWRGRFADDSSLALLGYALPITAGGVMLLASLIPLVMMPGRSARPMTQPVRPKPIPSAAGRRSWLAACAAPFADRRFRRLLWYRGWFSLANGITQAAQNIYPKAVLHLGVADLAIMRTSMQVGQLGLSPWIGRFADRFGSRPMLALSQAVVAASLIFFLLAADEAVITRWLILGAFLCWSFYAGINICLYHLMLKLPPPDEPRAPYVAAHEAVGSICYAASTITGGYLLDRLRDAQLPSLLGWWVGGFGVLFLIGLLMRAAAVLLIQQIPEPGAWTWREILTGKSREPVKPVKQPAPPEPQPAGKA